MTLFSDAVRGVVHPSYVQEGPFELEERAESSRCPSVLVRCRRRFWAVRIGDNDHLPILAELAKQRSVRSLPDYVIFAEPDGVEERSPDGEGDTLRVLICELKSSAAGAAEALRQVQLGKPLVEYLARVAAYQEGFTGPPPLWCCGVIVSPEFPASLSSKGRTRPGKVEPPSFYDKLSGMRVYQVRAGGEIHIESLF